jgi:hypothetical protein
VVKPLGNCSNAEIVEYAKHHGTPLEFANLLMYVRDELRDSLASSLT